MSQHIHFSDEKQGVIVAQRHLDKMRDAETDAWDALSCAITSNDLRRVEQAQDTLEIAKGHYDAACLTLADAQHYYREWCAAVRVQLSHAAETAAIRHLA